MRKRLNNKGFTLIELLILIMTIAIPNVLGNMSSMNSSRTSSLHSKAKSVAIWYSDTILAESLTNTADASKTIQSADISKISAGSWVCIGTLSKNFKNAVDLPASEYVLGDASSTTPDAITGAVTSTTTCSAIRSVRGKVEVVLVATQTGKFNVPGKTVTYAYTGDTTGKTYPA